MNKKSLNILVAFVVWLGMVEFGDRGITRFYINWFSDFNNEKIVNVVTTKAFHQFRTTTKRCRVTAMYEENGKLIRVSVFTLGSSSFPIEYCSKYRPGEEILAFADERKSSIVIANVGKRDVLDDLLVFFSPLIAWIFGSIWYWGKN